MAGAVIAGRFRLEEEIASGGMGTVWRALDLVDDAVVGLKLMRGDELRDAERFAQEAAILAGLRHPAIVRYVAHGAHGGDRYLVMEWLEGEDLAARLDRETVGLADTLAMLRRASDALAYAHERGVIHRDIKPQNLFLPAGRLDKLKLLDFGIARVCTNVRRLTRSGTLVGTPGYLAPEIVDGAPVVDGRADVFSLGCVAFECLTGRPAFKGQEPGVLLAKIMIEDPPDLAELVPGVPRGVADLIAKMLDKEVDRRPAAAAVLQALSTLRDVADVTAAPARRLKSSRLTVVEQRVTCMVMAESAELAPTTAPIVVPEDLLAERLPRDTEKLTALEGELVLKFGARLRLLPDGRLVVTWPEASRATEQATLAARCALLLRERLPDAAVAACLGLARAPGRVATGSVIDTSARLLRSTPPGHVRIDDGMAALVAARFETFQEGTAIYLRGERERAEPRRQLLGRRAQFVGRGQELSFLAGLLTDCIAEREAVAVMISGPAGIGKSRLLEEMLTWVDGKGDQVRVLSGAGDSFGAGAPFGLIGRAIRRHAGIQDSDSAEERRSKLAASVERHVAPEARRWVTVFLGEVAGVPFSDADHEALRAARGNPQLMGDATRRAFEAWLRAVCCERPVLLVLEDLHWGDAGTVGLVGSALRALKDQPLMVIGVARPDIHAVFPNLWAERRLQVIQLAGLSRRSCERLVAQTLGARADASLIARIVERADGNPFFLEELIRAAHEGRVDALPEPVLAMVQARLDAEGTNARRVLRAASVFGESFSAEGVAALLGGDAELLSIADTLERLADRELLVRLAGPTIGTEMPGFTFAHALVRDAAYAMLTEDDRALGHRLAAEHLGARGQSEPIVLAEHFWRAGETARSVPWYRRAAEQALAANDLAGAIVRANLGLAALADAAYVSGAPAPDADDQRGGLLLVQAEAHLWRGELGRAEETATGALALLRPGAAPWMHAAGLALVARGKQGKLGAMEALVEQVRGAPPVVEARDALVACLSEAASHLVAAGRYAPADALIEEAATLAAAPGGVDARAEALVRRARADRVVSAGDLVGSLDELHAALAAFEEAGDVRNACMVKSRIGAVHAELGQLDRAARLLEAAPVEAERLGLPEAAAIARRDLARARAWRGEWDAAEPLAASAVELFWAQGEPRLEGLARSCLAEILVATGRHAEAEREAERAARVLSVAPALRLQALAWRAEAQLGQGRDAEALASSREAYEALEALGSVGEGEAIVRLTHAECLHRNGRVEEAGAVLARARDRLLDRAARLPDEQARQDFLERIPANARTRERAAAWLGHEPLTRASTLG